MMTSSELRAQLEAGLTELEADIERVHAAIAALDEAGAASPSPAMTPRGRRDRARLAAGQAPVPEVVPAGKLAALLAAGDGVTTSELAQRTGGAPDQVLRMLKELEQAGAAHRSGNRRSTRWHGGGNGAGPAAGDSPPTPERNGGSEVGETAEAGEDS